ncbi:MAG: AraC family transcriptional regulator [Ruminococcus sp. SR1/5]|nr:AraC family transcriptional regulator [uncultured Blautia sp.]MBD8969822.1 AraC family transcriptional regulator [Ruminococcus sp.]
MSGDIISISVPPFPDFIEGNYRTMRKGQSHVDRKNLGFFDLIVVKKGALFLAEDEEQYEIRKNEMFILLPDRHHYSWKPCEEDTGFYWLHFYTTAQWKQGPKASRFVSRLPIPELHYHQCSYTLHLPKYARIREPELLFELFQNILDSTVPEAGNDIWKTEELFLHFLRFVENVGIHKDRLTLLAEQIQIYLENNLDQPVTNQVLEEHFHLHRNYLAKATKQTFGKTSLEVLLEIRMEYAKQYLLRTDYDIQKISKLVGFTSEIYFSGCFKKYMGISPRNYRKKYEEKT